MMEHDGMVRVRGCLIFVSQGNNVIYFFIVLLQSENCHQGGQKHWEKLLVSPFTRQTLHRTVLANK